MCAADARHRGGARPAAGQSRRGAAHLAAGERRHVPARVGTRGMVFSGRGAWGRAGQWQRWRSGALCRLCDSGTALLGRPAECCVVPGAGTQHVATPVTPDMTERRRPRPANSRVVTVTNCVQL